MNRDVLSLVGNTIKKEEDEYTKTSFQALADFCTS
jgi:hypothetical protein